MKLIASRPYRTHIFSVASFQDLKNVQEELITRLCAAVDEQLNSLVSGEEGELDQIRLYPFFWFWSWFVFWFFFLLWS